MCTTVSDLPLLSEPESYLNPIFLQLCIWYRRARQMDIFKSISDAISLFFFFCGGCIAFCDAWSGLPDLLVTGCHKQRSSCSWVHSINPTHLFLMLISLSCTILASICGVLHVNQVLTMLSLNMSQDTWCFVVDLSSCAPSVSPAPPPSVWLAGTPEDNQVAGGNLFEEIRIRERGRSKTPAAQYWGVVFLSSCCFQFS